ncbi:MAG: hypothetical protein ACI9FB_003866 [Candidatus Azotimanducaceae bacterium]
MLVVPENAELFTKGVSDFNSFSDPDRLRYVFINMQIFKNFENAYYQANHGRLDQYFWEGMSAQLQDYMAVDGAIKVWELRKHQFGREFREYGDSLETSEYAL